MPRRARAISAGGIFHVTARGNDRRAIFVDDADRLAYLALLSDVCTKFEWQSLAHCLMGNHVHLLIETRQPNLGQGMHRLQGMYAQRFNRRHGRIGHLFQERFYSVRIETDVQLFAATNYIAMNPVKAALCSAPEEWEWSDITEADRRLRAIYGLPSPPAA